MLGCIDDAFRRRFFAIRPEDTGCSRPRDWVLGSRSLWQYGSGSWVTQLIAGRERPTEGSGNGNFWQNNAFGSSFPSGLSSFTWTNASVVAHEYPKPWVRWLVYGTATTVSVTRVKGLNHFPSDVAVGGAFGYLIGQQIFTVHCVPGQRSHCRSSRKSVKSKESRNHLGRDKSRNKPGT